LTYWQKNSYYSAKKSGKNDSKFEAGKANELELLKKAGEIKDFREQVTLELIVNTYLVCTYKIDFIVEHHDGMFEYIETKGYATPQWKLKWKLFEALYSDKPNTKLTLEFQGKSWKPQRRRIKGNL
jgi:hypothetical protein